MYLYLLYCEFPSGLAYEIYNGNLQWKLMMQDFPHVPAPILMQGLIICPEHILVQYRAEFPEDFPLVIRQLTCCRITIVHIISCIRTGAGFSTCTSTNPDAGTHDIS